MFLQDDKYKIVLRKQTHITDCHTVHYIEYHRPLLGLIDVTIVGHLGSPAYIGAIAVGGMLFNIIYWIFGFLRMGTSGMTRRLTGNMT